MPTEKVVIQYETNAEELGRLTQQLEAATAAGDANTQGIRNNIAQLERQQKELKQLIEAEEETARKAKATGEAFGKVGGSAAKLSGVLNAVVPGLGDAAASLGDVGDAGEVGSEVMENFSGALKGNALVLGTLAAAIGVGLVAYQAYNREVEELNAQREVEHRLALELKGVEAGLAEAQTDLAVATGQLSEAGAEELRIRRQIQAAAAEALTAHQDEVQALQASIDASEKYLKVQRGLAIAIAVTAGLPGAVIEAATSEKELGEILKRNINIVNDTIDVVTGLESANDAAKAKIETLNQAGRDQVAVIKETGETLLKTARAARGLAAAEAELAAFVAGANADFETQLQLSAQATSAYAGLTAELSSLEQAAIEERAKMRRSELEQLDHERNALIAAEQAKLNLLLEQLDGNISAQETLLENFRHFREASDAIYEAKKTALIEDALARRAALEEAAASRSRGIQEAQLEYIRQSEAEKTQLNRDYSQAVLGLQEQFVQATTDGLAAVLEATGASEKEIFRMKKASALALGAVQAAGAILTALQTPYPLTIPAVAIAGITSGIQLGLIAAQQPPSYRGGGIIGAESAVLPSSPAQLPDVRLVGMEDGEGALSRQGVQTLGGKEGVNRANDGIPPQPTQVNLKLGHRIMQEVFVEAGQRGGAFRAMVTGGYKRLATNPYPKRGT